MAEYGHILDSQQSFEKMRVRGLAEAYFGNPKLTKVKETDSGDSVFASRVDLVVNEPRYLLCMVAGVSFPLGTERDMSGLEWYSLQTRHIDDDLPCSKFIYSARGGRPFDTRLELIERGESMTTYKNVEFGFRVGLFHTDTKSRYEYPDFGTFATALETYEATLLI